MNLHMQEKKKKSSGTDLHTQGCTFKFFELPCSLTGSVDPHLHTPKRSDNKCTRVSCVFVLFFFSRRDIPP